LKNIVEKVVARIKRNPAYKLDNTYSVKQLYFILWYRFFQVMRGFILKIKVSSSGLIFCGRGAVIQHGYQLKVGRNLILEEGVHIDALSHEGIILGDNVTIAKYSILACTGVIANKGIGIYIGNNSAIGAHSFLGGQGGIKIGSDVIIGPYVKIFSENHNYDLQDIVIRMQGESRKGITIADNCWVGAGAIILDGVAISNGCIIAAGSVVTDSVPENSVVAGVPAKVIKSRKKLQN
jgi:acetyltransferase-like isoleucine patch superfamily enzyme